MSSPPSRPAEDLQEEIRSHPQWYHTLTLGPGVVTPGWFDLQEVPDRVPFPGDLSGRRCLDVGTFDGFWAFTMEERGADEVVAVDLVDHTRWDWPSTAPPAAVAALGRRKNAGRGFQLARRARGSRVVYEERSVYDLNPEELGAFDFVHVGSLLLHLRDPIRALEAVRSVCRGTMLVLDAIHLPNTLRHPRQPTMTLDALDRPYWWKPNRAGLRRMVEAAGLQVLAGPQVVLMPPGPGQRRGRRFDAGLLRSPEGRAVWFRTRFGDPHAAVLARPTGGLAESPG